MRGRSPSLLILLALSTGPVEWAGRAAPLWPSQAPASPLSGDVEPGGAGRYLELCREAHGLLEGRSRERQEAASEAVRLLSEATRLLPDAPGGWSLLGRALLLTGNVRDATRALHRARRLGGDDPRLLSSLALSAAISGDLQGALAGYQRLLLRGAQAPELLRRTGDVLMALGRLDEAIAAYRRVCHAPPEAHPPPARGGQSVSLGSPEPREHARACLALAVALDRDEQSFASREAVSLALQIDPLAKALFEQDFVPAGDRDYYRAIVAREGAVPCAETIALRDYLARPAPLFEARARARLERLSGACNKEYIASPDEPLGSQLDRDGRGATWQTPNDAGAK